MYVDVYASSIYFAWYVYIVIFTILTSGKLIFWFGGGYEERWRQRHRAEKVSAWARCKVVEGGACFKVVASFAWNSNRSDTLSPSPRKRICSLQSLVNVVVPLLYGDLLSHDVHIPAQTFEETSDFDPVFVAEVILSFSNSGLLRKQEFCRKEKETCVGRADVSDRVTTAAYIIQQNQHNGENAHHAYLNAIVHTGKLELSAVGTFLKSLRNSSTYRYCVPSWQLAITGPCWACIIGSFQEKSGISLLLAANLPYFDTANFPLSALSTAVNRPCNRRFSGTQHAAACCLLFSGGSHRV